MWKTLKVWNWLLQKFKLETEKLLKHRTWHCRGQRSMPNCSETKKEALIRSQCWMPNTWKVSRGHHNTASFQWPVNPGIKDMVTVSCQQDCTSVLTNTWIYRCSRTWCFAFIHLVTAPNNSTFFTWMFSHKHIQCWNSQSFKVFKTYESHNILEYLCWHLHWRCKAMLGKKTL